MENDLLFGTYRCPVCGHQDSTEWVPDRLRDVIACTYCGTRLEVTRRRRGSVRLTVQVAHQVVPG